MTIDLEAIKARAKAATAGPWCERGKDDPAWGMVGYREITDANGVWLLQLWNKAEEPFTNGPANAAFIAHARADVPALVAEVERLREVLEEIQLSARQVLAIVDQGRTPRHEWVIKKIRRITNLTGEALDGGDE